MYASYNIQILPIGNFARKSGNNTDSTYAQMPEITTAPYLDKCNIKCISPAAATFKIFKYLNPVATAGRAVESRLIR